jgi:hypothetical protein
MFERVSECKVGFQEEVQSEDFLEGEFFGGEVGYINTTLAPPTRACVKTFADLKSPNSLKSISK